ncbi:hypothetical protein BGZ94_001561 [Podila epigama]|nr:hypothetical protein BGZ94_001561 [Podila epigama]
MQLVNNKNVASFPERALGMSREHALLFDHAVIALKQYQDAKDKDIVLVKDAQVAMSERACHRLEDAQENELGRSAKAACLLKASSSTSENITYSNTREEHRAEARVHLGGGGSLNFWSFCSIWLMVWPSEPKTVVFLAYSILFQYRHKTPSQLTTTTTTTTNTTMADKQPAPAGRAKSSFHRVSFFGWIIRLLPAILFYLYTFAHRGVYQPPLCVALLYNCPRTPIHIEGLMDRPEHYSQVVSYLISLFTHSEDVGASLAVFVDGKPVIDVYGGSKDLAKTVPYNNKTLQQVYSSGKVIESIIIARLVQQGLLDYDSKITEYWPEFGQNGKEEVTLGDLMTHQAGVSGLDDPHKQLTWAHLNDQKAFSERLARQRHSFNGEKTRAYHAVTRGWYLNEIVRRVDPKGRTIGQIVSEELMGDYKDVELYYASLPREEDWDERLSEMHDYPVLRLIGRLVLPQVLVNNKYIGFPSMSRLHPMVRGLFHGNKALKDIALAMAPTVDKFRVREAHVVDSPSFSLKTNAHSLAKIMSMMANKGAAIKAGEPDLLDREIYEKATAFHSEKYCEVTMETYALSVGGWVKTKQFLGPNKTGPLQGVEVQGWAGAGGSIAVWIEELGLSFAYVTNAFGPPESTFGDYRGMTLLDRVVYARKEELGLLPDKKEAKHA